MVKKGKGVCFVIILECIECCSNFDKCFNGVNCYIMMKNCCNIIVWLELKKFCIYCNKYIIYKEIK